MTSIIITALIVFALAMVLKALFQPTSRKKWPYKAKRLMSAPEQVLYRRLVKALPDRLVFAQVGVSRILAPTTSGKNYRIALNRIDRLSVDFLICNPDSSVLAAIELDDSSHKRPGRRANDEKKSAAFESAGITLIRWNVKALPDEATIRIAIAPPAPMSPSSPPRRMAPTI